jgi:hypothetical protein
MHRRTPQAQAPSTFPVQKAWPWGLMRLVVKRVSASRLASVHEQRSDNDGLTVDRKNEDLRLPLDGPSTRNRRERTVHRLPILHFNATFTAFRSSASVGRVLVPHMGGWHAQGRLDRNIDSSLRSMSNRSCRGTLSSSTRSSTCWKAPLSPASKTMM